MRQAITSKKGWLSGQSFVPHRLELVVSFPWRKRPIPLMRIIERLEIEDMRHAGGENGNLYVSYTQFVAYGISRSAIRPMLDLGVEIGLIAIIQAENWVGDLRPENAYRLTYLPAKGQKAPSDEWRYVTDERVAKAVKIAKALVNGRKATKEDCEEEEEQAVA